MHGIVKSLVRNQHSLICHYTTISRNHKHNLCVNHSCTATA